jgi:hypothetical protein
VLDGSEAGRGGAKTGLPGRDSLDPNVGAHSHATRSHVQVESTVITTLPLLIIVLGAARLQTSAAQRCWPGAQSTSLAPLSLA